jgi:large subunit ribosomal protein L4
MSETTKTVKATAKPATAKVTAPKAAAKPVAKTATAPKTPIAKVSKPAAKPAKPAAPKTPAAKPAVLKTPVAKTSTGAVKIDVLDHKGHVADHITVSGDVFGADINTYVIHQVAVSQQNNGRQGTKSTLTRSEVRGHAKKPYRQKGTGNARQGSTKGPQFYGGGVVFAPKPRDFTTKINKKTRSNAFVSALSGKLADSELIVLTDTNIADAKTQIVAKLLDAIKVGARKTLFVTEAHNENFVRAVSNIPNATVTTASQLSVLDIVNNKYLVAGVAAVRLIEEAYK